MPKTPPVDPENVEFVTFFKALDVSASSGTNMKQCHSTQAGAGQKG